MYIALIHSFQRRVCFYILVCAVSLICILVYHYEKECLWIGHFFWDSVCMGVCVFICVGLLQGRLFLLVVHFKYACVCVSLIKHRDTCTQTHTRAHTHTHTHIRESWRWLFGTELKRENSGEEWRSDRTATGCCISTQLTPDPGSNLYLFLALSLSLPLSPSLLLFLPPSPSLFFIFPLFQNIFFLKFHHSVDIYSSLIFSCPFFLLIFSSSPPSLLHLFIPVVHLCSCSSLF